MKFHVQPIVIPQFNGYLSEARHLNFALGLLLVIMAALVFSIWREHLMSLREDERAKFLMFNIKGGSWLVAVFAFCGGVYFLAASFALRI